MSSGKDEERGLLNISINIESKNPTHTIVLATDLNNLFNPLAVYDDWMAWYMYLVECWVDRPMCDDPTQSARIGPFFAAIGRDIDRLKSMKGIDVRLNTILNQKQNNPDSTLYELLVAACYARNGWEVAFLQETREGKTPDLEVKNCANATLANAKGLRNK